MAATALQFCALVLFSLLAVSRAQLAVCAVSFSDASCSINTSRALCANVPTPQCVADVPPGGSAILSCAAGNTAVEATPSASGTTCGSSGSTVTAQAGEVCLVPFA